MRLWTGRRLINLSRSRRTHTTCHSVTLALRDYLTPRLLSGTERTRYPCASWATLAPATTSSPLERAERNIQNHISTRLTRRAVDTTSRTSPVIQTRTPFPVAYGSPEPVQADVIRHAWIQDDLSAQTAIGSRPSASLGGPRTASHTAFAFRHDRSPPLPGRCRHWLETGLSKRGLFNYRLSEDCVHFGTAVAYFHGRSFALARGSSSRNHWAGLPPEWRVTAYTPRRKFNRMTLRASSHAILRSASLPADRLMRLRHRRRRDRRLRHSAN